MVEVHAIGFDAEGREVVQAWQPRADVDGPERPGWKMLHLDETRKVAVSGYFSEAPRSDFVLDATIVRLLGMVETGLAEPAVPTVAAGT